jgi:hypothetical protein
MNENEAMRRLAAANPIPEVLPPGSSQGQFALRTVLAQARVGRSRRRWVVASAAAAAVLIGATAFGLRPEPVQPPPRATVVAPPAVFDAAATDAGKAPGQGRFMHVSGVAARVVHVEGQGGYDVLRVDHVRAMRPADGRPGEGWLTIEERGASVRPVTTRDAVSWRRAGSPVPPRSDDLLVPDLADDPDFDGDVAALPDDPMAAASAMLAPLGTGTDRQGWLFRECTRLLDAFTSTLTGADRAKLFRALAGLTGVRTLGATTDPAGRPATGLAYTGETPRYGQVDWQIYLLAGTDRIGFTQAVVRRPGPANRTLAPGTVQYSVAVLETRRSDTP